MFAGQAHFPASTATPASTRLPASTPVPPLLVGKLELAPVLAKRLPVWHGRRGSGLKARKRLAPPARAAAALREGETENPGHLRDLPAETGVN
jgi:hypothetical protein